MTLEKFAKMCRDHDLTYQYSDDHRYRVRGTESFDAIKRASALLPAEDVRRIWNAEVDRKIVEGQREPFYWRTA